MNLLLTHTDPDGITPVILLKLINNEFEYKTFEPTEISKFVLDNIDTDSKNHEEVAEKENIEETINLFRKCVRLQYHRFLQCCESYRFLHLRLGVRQLLL